MSKTSKRLRFLTANCEYVTIEREPGGFKVTLGGEEWEGVIDACEAKTVAKAVRGAVREIGRHDVKRAKEARRLG